VAHQVALYALRWRLWSLTGHSHGLRASNSLHGVLGRKLAGDGAVRGRLRVIRAAAPTVFRYCVRARNTESARSPGEKAATV